MSKNFRDGERGAGTSNASSSALLDSISLNTFEQSNFSVGSLLANLTEGLIKVERENEKGFNPDPFISTLENTIEKLIPLRSKVTQKIQTLELNLNQKENDYKNRVENFKGGLNNATREFSDLDSKITEVGKTVIRVGEQLESIERARSRASEVHDIILYYNEFSRGETNRLEALRKEGREGRSKVAVMAKRLLAVAKEVEGVEGGEVTRTTIEKYAERFEKDMLRLFEKAYLKGEPKAMAHCAQTLLDFNGGHSCIQIYVNQHDFFISRERIDAVNYVTETPMWEALADPNKPPPKSEPELETLYLDIRDQISQEAQIIEAVFPQPVVVMKVFIQRVFAQVVQAHIEKLMSAAQGCSNLAFLRVLAIARSSTARLINDLKALDFFRSSSLPTQSSFDKFNPLTGSGGGGGRSGAGTGGGGEGGSGSGLGGRSGDDNAADGGGDGETNGMNNQTGNQVGGMAVSTLSAVLDQQLDELFSQHLDNSRYLERESKSLTELYASYLLKFARWHRAMNKAKPTNTIFDRMVNQLSTAASQAGSGTSQTTGLKSLLKLSGVKSNNKANEGEADEAEAEAEIEDGDGDLNLEVAEKLLTWHAESIGRMIELSSPSEVPKNVFGLLKALAESFCKGYVETGLETSHSQLLSQDSKLEPDLKPMKVIRIANLSMHLWQRYVTTAINPLTSTSVTFRREMSIFNQQILVRIETKINSIVQKSLELTISWLNACLNKQKKVDFKPKNEEIEFTRMNTEACESCCEFLSRIRSILEDSLSGKNHEVFLNEVGVVFHSMLLEHLKKFPVSAIGGLMLTKDLAMYQDTIAKFEMSDLNDRFEMLRELGNIFVVQPSILKSYLSESMLGKIDTRLLRPFFTMRADYGDQPKKFWDEVVGIGVSGPTSTTGGGNGGGSGGIGLGLGLGLGGSNEVSNQNNNNGGGSSNSGVGGNAGSSTNNPTTEKSHWLSSFGGGGGGGVGS